MSFKKSLKYLGVILIFAIFYMIYTQYSRLNIISGYSAKSMSSSVFVAGREADFIDATDNNFSPVNIADNVVDIKSKSVETSVYGMMTRRAIYREGLGSVLVPQDFDENTTFLTPKRSKVPSGLSFPYGDQSQKDTVFESVDYDKLTRVVNGAFEDEPTTRAILIVYKDQIIAEKYAEGFNEKSIQLGWSMTKSLTSTVFGILQKQGKLNVTDNAPINLWKNDARLNITINNLLQMNSGLEWEEDYTKISDATRMLFLERNMGKVQETKRLASKPNEAWYYSSGTTNLLSNISRSYFFSHQDYLDFWYADFIDKIGMHSMTVEADIDGNYVGSSYGWATPRDWAKFGLLYLHKGNWNGEQLFEASWTDYVTSPTNTSEGIYGGQFWLNSEGHLPNTPKDTFFASGYQGQRVFILPSKDMVVVRLGITPSKIDQLLKDVSPKTSSKNKEIIKFELNNIVYDGLLKDIIATIQ